MERDNRDEDMMLKGTKQEMPGFYFRLLRSEEKRELWNSDFELLFLLIYFVLLILSTPLQISTKPQ